MSYFQLGGDDAEAEDEIAECDKVVARFIGSPEPDLRQKVADAFYRKGVWLGQLGRM
jgi:hypothetical protein